MKSAYAYRERIEGNAILRFHLIPQARAREGSQKQRVEIVHAVPAGHLDDTFADARFVDVQTDDKGTHDQYAVPLYAPPRIKWNSRTTSAMGRCR